MQDQTHAEYWPLPSTPYSGLSGRHGQGVSWTGVTSTTYPGASVPGPSFRTPAYPEIYGEGPSFHFHEPGFAYGIPPQVSCDYTSQVPTTVSDNAICDSEANQDTDAYPVSAPAEQCDTQVSWRYTFRLTRSPKTVSDPLYSPFRRSFDRCLSLRAICNRHLSRPHR